MQRHQLPWTCIDLPVTATRHNLKWGTASTSSLINHLLWVHVGRHKVSDGQRRRNRSVSPLYLLLIPLWIFLSISVSLWLCKFLSLMRLVHVYVCYRVLYKSDRLARTLEDHDGKRLKNLVDACHRTIDECTDCVRAFNFFLASQTAHSRVEK